MTAILSEHFAGKFPFWLSPRQFMIVPVHDSCSDYAAGLAQTLQSCGYKAEVDLSSNTLDYKIRSAQTKQFCYTLTVGQREKSAGSANLRARGQIKDEGTFALEDLLARFSIEGDPLSQTG